MQPLSVAHLQLAPLGAGDLIDRSLRLYRRHFGPLIRASVPPVLVTATGGGLMTFARRGIAVTASEERVVLYVLLLLVGIGVWALGLLAHLVVMGGASRNLVTHLLWGERVTARAIYRNVRARFFGLFWAAVLVGVFMLVVGGGCFLAWYALLLLTGLVTALAIAGGVPVWLGAVFGVVTFTAATLFVLWLYFFLFGFVAYVPQALMVEGRGVFDAVGRSIGLGGRNSRRLMAMFLFSSFVAWSAVTLLLLPLGWLGWVSGVEVITIDQSSWPAWYAVGYEVVQQVGTTLLVPVWTYGLSLLYVDERVRREGYDVELLAARSLGDVPTQDLSPLAPAVSGGREPEAGAAPPRPPDDYTEERFRASVLGLGDRR